MKQLFLLAAFAAMAALTPPPARRRPADERPCRRPLPRPGDLGPTPASIAQLEQIGINAWLAAQFKLNTPTCRISQSWIPPERPTGI